MPWMPWSLRSNQSKELYWYYSVMQNVIITFQQLIFIDASTSGFKSELIIRSLLHASEAILMLFFKILMQTVLTRCKIVFWYWFMQTENGKLLMCNCFALLPLKFILTSFVKGARKFYFLFVYLYFICYKVCYRRISGP